MKALVFSGICMVLLAACASAPEVANNEAAAPAAAEVKCKRNMADAPTGSSITRRDCSANPDVQAVDAKELLDQKRFSMPADPGRH
jgi:hypothetical protein